MNRGVERVQAEMTRAKRGATALLAIALASMTAACATSGFERFGSAAVTPQGFGWPPAGQLRPKEPNSVEIYTVAPVRSSAWGKVWAANYSEADARFALQQRAGKTGCDALSEVRADCEGQATCGGWRACCHASGICLTLQ